MCLCEAHVLAPITAKTGTPKKFAEQGKFFWTPIMQQSFKKLKVDVLCANLNHEKPFHMYTVASDISFALASCRITNLYYTKAKCSTEHSIPTPPLHKNYYQLSLH